MEIITQWRCTRTISVFKSQFILQLIQYVVGFSLELGSAGADLLWRLKKTPQVATAGLFTRGGNLSPYRNSTCTLVATYIHSFSANFLEKVIFQRNRVGAAEILSANWFLVG